MVMTDSTIQLALIGCIAHPFNATHAAHHTPNIQHNNAGDRNEFIFEYAGQSLHDSYACGTNLLETDTLANLPPEASWKERQMSTRLHLVQLDAIQILKILKNLHAWVSGCLLEVVCEEWGQAAAGFPPTCSSS